MGVRWVLCVLFNWQLVFGFWFLFAAVGVVLGVGVGGGRVGVGMFQWAGYTRGELTGAYIRRRRPKTKTAKCQIRHGQIRPSHKSNQIKHQAKFKKAPS